MMRPLALLALLALAACGTPGDGINPDNLPGTPYPDAINPRGFMLNDGTLILFRELPPNLQRR